MPIGGDSYAWKEENVNKVEPTGATYAFFDKAGGCIYIGSTSNLRERFTHYWSTNFSENPCKQDTVEYKREYRDDYQKRERVLLREYQLAHGILPKCNEKTP